MCGRVKQDNDPAIYFDYTRWNPLEHMELDFRPSPNVPPGTRPLVLHRLGDGAEQANTLFWGYKPPWPTWKKPPTGNANLTTVLKRSRMWEPLLAHRVIMPCEGWYEWTGEKPNKQPWFISPKDGNPLLLAGIPSWPQHGWCWSMANARLMLRGRLGASQTTSRGPLCNYVTRTRDCNRRTANHTAAAPFHYFPRVSSYIRSQVIPAILSRSAYPATSRPDSSIRAYSSASKPMVSVPC